MQIVRKMLAFLLVVVMIAAITACGGGSETSTENAGSTPDPSNKKSLLDAKKLDTPKVIIMSHYSLFEGFKESFSEHYGGEIEEILVPVTDYLTKTSSMVMSGQALDGVVRDSNAAIHFLTFIARDLVKSFDDYIDLDEPIYDNIRDHIEAAKWDNNYYYLGHTANASSMVFYNIKLFEQVGLDTPWELYERDEWTWDAFNEAAEMLAQDSTNDGEIDIFGGVIAAPELLVASTGKPLGQIVDGSDLNLNLRDSDVSRALQFTHDFQNKEYALSQPTSWPIAFNRERLAMAVTGSWTIGIPEVQGIMEAGNLGIAPVPRDPNNNKQSSAAALIGWVMPKDATNPEGLVAFNKCMVYVSNYDEERLEKQRQDWEENNRLELMQRRELILKSPDRVVEWGQAFFHSYLWQWGLDIPWSTYVESIEPIILAEKAEAIRSVE